MIKKRHIRHFVGLAALTIFSSSVSPSLHYAATQEGTVTASWLNVRQSASSTAKIMFSLKNNSVVSVLKKEGVWYQVSYQGRTGYVHSSYVKVSQLVDTKPVQSVASTSSQKIVQASPFLNMRSGAATSYGIVGKIPNASKVQVVSSQGAWSQVVYGSVKGYVHSSYLKELPASPAPEPTNSLPVSNGTYTVQKGDTLYRISVASNVSVSDLKTANGLSSSQIRIGQKLVIPTLQSTPAPAPVPANPSSEKYVNASVLNVRQGPGTSYAKIGTVRSGEKVTVSSVSNNWAKIVFNGQPGYVHTNYLTATPVSSVINANLTGKVILLDPGHGGTDPGAIANGIYEKELVLDVSNRLKQKLTQAGATVIMSRSNDVFYSLRYRTDLSAHHQPDVFISIHGNSAEATSASGIETFYYNSSRDYHLASAIQTKLIEKTGAVNRRAKYENLFVTRENVVPSVLVELGFLSNYTEAQKLKTSSYRDLLATGLYEGIVNHFQ